MGTRSNPSSTFPKLEATVTPPHDDGKYSTPPLGSAYSWFKKDLEFKADKAWVEAKLEGLSEREDDTKRLALEAKERAGMPHDCNQKDTIGKLQDSLDGWGKWLRGILVSALIFVVTVGGGWLYQYFTLSAKVDNTQSSVQNIEKTVEKMDESQRELRDSLKEQTRKSEEMRRIQIDEVKAAMSQALKDLSQSQDNRR